MSRCHKSYQLHETRNSETVSEGTLDEGEVIEENVDVDQDESTGSQELMS